MDDRDTRELAAAGPAAAAVAWTRGHLPRGAGISSASFAARHRVARWSIVALGGLLVVVGLTRGERIDHLAVDLGPIALPAVVAWRARRRLVASLAGAWALMACASVLVHLTGGLIEAHFMYFVVLTLVAVYQDWRIFLGSIGFVLVSHGVVGVLSPESMYNHPAAIEHPMLWALIHAAFVFALVVVLVVEWQFADADQQVNTEVLRDLRTTQAMLIQAEKLESIGQLAAGIAHEINTPIQYVTDNSTFLEGAFTDLLGALDRLEALAREGHADEADAIVADADIEFLRAEIPLALAQSHEGLGRVSEIVRAMKDFSHPGSELAAADLNHAIGSTITVSRNEWKYVATLEFAPDESLPPVRCHEGQIKQVVLNMIVNAAHAIGSAGHDATTGRIVVTTSVGPDGHVRLAVGDNGTGIPDALRARIFDPFFTTKEVGKGTGQGLSVAHRIIAAHAGTISVDTEPGRGTTFTIELPVDGPRCDDPALCSEQEAESGVAAGLDAAGVAV